jgi:hypothetical protein
MRGIFSGAPGQSAIRLVVGTHLLMLVQSWLVLTSGHGLNIMLRILVGGTAIIALVAFIAAIHGGSDSDGRVWSPRDRRARGRVQ